MILIDKPCCWELSTFEVQQANEFLRLSPKERGEIFDSEREERREVLNELKTKMLFFSLIRNNLDSKDNLSRREVLLQKEVQKVQIKANQIREEFDRRSTVDPKKALTYVGEQGKEINRMLEEIRKSAQGIGIVESYQANTALGKRKYESIIS